MVWDKQLHFNDPATSNMKFMLLYHGIVMTICAIVMAVVLSGFWSIFYSAKNDGFCNEYTNNDLVESLWTGVPMILLFALCAPSLNLLYLSGLRPGGYELNLKVVGHQWYWSYEYSWGSKGGTFDSYMAPWDGDEEGMILYMDVDNRCVLPVNMLIRMLYSSVDVIHSWFIPSFGFKNDCVPGRIGSASLNIKEPGVYYGFCTELCGAMHSEMPIVVEALPSNSFFSWLDSIVE